MSENKILTRYCTLFREEIIAEHPEILVELEEERDRMMAEKERLEKELAQAEKRTSMKNPHTAFIPDTNKSSEEVDLDSIESEFDVIGHQEPLSDTRVHETPLDDTLAETPIDTADRPVESTTEKQITNGETNVHLEIFTEMRERIQRDFTLVADIVFPKAIRGPVTSILRSAGKVTKQVAMDLYEFVKRHVMAIIEKRQNRDESSSTDNDKQANASTVSNDRP